MILVFFFLLDNNVCIYYSTIVTNGAWPLHVCAMVCKNLTSLSILLLKEMFIAYTVVIAFSDDLYS